MKFHKIQPIGTWICYTGLYGLAAFDWIESQVYRLKNYNVREFQIMPVSFVMDSQLIVKYAFTDETGEIFIKLDVTASDLLDNSYKLEIAVSNMLCALSNWLENGHGHPLNPFEQSEMKELLDHFYSHSFENNKVIDTYASIRDLLKNCDK